MPVGLFLYDPLYLEHFAVSLDANQQKITLGAYFLVQPRQKRSPLEIESRKKRFSPVPVGYLWLCSSYVTSGSGLLSHDEVVDELDATLQH